MVGKGKPPILQRTTVIVITFANVKNNFIIITELQISIKITGYILPRTDSKYESFSSQLMLSKSTLQKIGQIRSLLTL